MVLGIPTMGKHSFEKRLAKDMVPSPPTQTRASNWPERKKRRACLETSLYSTFKPLRFAYKKGLVRLVVPRIVPPCVKIPETLSIVKGRKRPSINPAKPSSIPKTSQP